jgi:hypothetical protein
MGLKYLGQFCLLFPHRVLREQRQVVVLFFSIYIRKKHYVWLEFCSILLIVNMGKFPKLSEP